MCVFYVSVCVFNVLVCVCFKCLCVRMCVRLLAQMCVSLVCVCTRSCALHAFAHVCVLLLSISSKLFLQYVTHADSCSSSLYWGLVNQAVAYMITNNPDHNTTTSKLILSSPYGGNVTTPKID